MRAVRGMKNNVPSSGPGVEKQVTVPRLFLRFKNLRNLRKEFIPDAPGWIGFPPQSRVLRLPPPPLW